MADPSAPGGFFLHDTRDANVHKTMQRHNVEESEMRVDRALGVDISVVNVRAPQRASFFFCHNIARVHTSVPAH